MPLPYGPPNKQLARELGQVAIEATNLSDVLDGSNVSLETFPTDSLKALCHALIGLTEGTAENCRPPLELARNVLPQIRRQYFALEEEESEHPAARDEMPPQLYRGMSLDQHINLLLSAVATALDEYRTQAKERFNDEVRAEPVGEIDDQNILSEAYNVTTDVIKGIENATNDLDNSQLSYTQQGDILRRRLKDGQNLSLAARSQLRTRPIVRNWFENITNALRKTPDLISSAGRAIQMGASLAQPLVDWWIKFERDALNGLINKVRDLGRVLEVIGERLRKPRSMGARYGTTPSATEHTSVEDDVRKMLLSGITPSQTLAAQVKYMNLRGSRGAPNRIPKWEDVALLSNVENLEISYTNFDIERHLYHLKNLRHLLRLGLAVNTSLRNLGDIRQLKSLSLHAPRIQTIRPISGLKNLEELFILANNIESLAPLSGLVNLKSLSIVADYVSDLYPISYLTNLRSLSIQANSAGDIGFLRKLSQLQRLLIHSHIMRSIEPISSLHQLTSLSIHGNRIEDFEYLRELTNLKTLFISSMSLDNVRFLENTKYLEELHIDGAKHPIDVSPLRKLVYLKRINTTQAGIDMRPLTSSRYIGP